MPVNLIPEDYFYSDLEAKEFEVASESPVNENVAKLDYIYGHDSYKNYNALILDRDTIIFASGISYTIYNHFTREKHSSIARQEEESAPLRSIQVESTSQLQKRAHGQIFLSTSTQA